MRRHRERQIGLGGMDLVEGPQVLLFLTFDFKFVLGNVSGASCDCNFLQLGERQVAEILIYPVDDDPDVFGVCSFEPIDETGRWENKKPLDALRFSAI
jgi:hypothetical protein